MPHLRGIFYFVPMPAICVNGNFYEEDQPVLMAGNSGFKYGDGVFETARFSEGSLLLQDFHFDRLFAGLERLQINSTRLNRQMLLTNIGQLCEKNGCATAARIRLAVYREGDNSGYVMEAAPLSETFYALEEKGYRIDIFPGARKAMDDFSNLKSANYLPYTMAARFAAEKGLDEALVLNAAGYICDGSKTNIFLVKQASIQTPALHQGCVSGVMRRNVIDKLRQYKIFVEEGTITEQDLLAADALFLTNAIRGIRWVAKYRDNTYSEEPVKRIWEQVFQTN
ncbi:MAG: hypothetical protein JWP88_2378 [Flaviaesturariibacter sp.]|nr:hypothetical protein [Flaviaesturariibacter sp.]